MAKKILIMCDRCKDLKSKKHSQQELSNIRNKQAHFGQTGFIDWIDSKLFVLEEEIGTLVSTDCQCRVIYQEQI